MNTPNETDWPRPLTAEEIDWTFDEVMQAFDAMSPTPWPRELEMAKALFEAFRRSVHAGLDPEGFRTAYRHADFVTNEDFATELYSDIRAAVLDPSDVNADKLVAWGDEADRLRGELENERTEDRMSRLLDARVISSDDLDL